MGRGGACVMSRRISHRSHFEREGLKSSEEGGDCAPLTIFPSVCNRISKRRRNHSSLKNWLTMMSGWLNSWRKIKINTIKNNSGQNIDNNIAPGRNPLSMKQSYWPNCWFRSSRYLILCRMYKIVQDRKIRNGEFFWPVTFCPRPCSFSIIKPSSIITRIGC